MVVVLGLVVTIIHRRFVSGVNLTALAYTVSTTSIIGLGQLIVLGAGVMDLSLGGIGGLCGIAAGWALVQQHSSVPEAVASGGGLGRGLRPHQRVACKPSALQHGDGLYCHSCVRHVLYGSDPGSDKGYPILQPAGRLRCTLG